VTTTAKPTSKQLAYLRSLAQATGETFTYPHTKAQASAQIRRLRQRTPSTRNEQRRERKQIARDLHERPQDACRVDLDRETSGYGANATWR
jgi:hypothetical protein